MALFATDSITLCCGNVQLEKQWWIETFDRKQTRVPVDWDCPLPSDVALKLPGAKSAIRKATPSRSVKSPDYSRARFRNSHQNATPALTATVAALASMEG